ncbi:MAG: rSAM/selenodomain-associated transferase 1 [Sediminicola sp.]|jgi:rSAM/selenodomain-associated transferase 1
MAFQLNKQETDDALEVYHLPTSKNALIIFARNPELGKCKTRLAKTVGDEDALTIYKILLQHTVEISKNLNLDKYVYYSDSTLKNDVWDKEIFRKKKQDGEDLGNRMENAFLDLFTAGYEKIIIIGSDMYDLSKIDLENAFSCLDNNDIVIGPASDGGYYLFGMKKLYPLAFKNKNWGTNTVLKDTMADLLNNNVCKLEERNDIDVYEDIVGLEIFKKFLVKETK